MLSTGVYLGVASADYHADPAPKPSLSSGIVRTLLQKSPLHAFSRHPRLAERPAAEHKEAFDLGSLAHALLLHDERNFEICEENDWRTKAARETRERAYAEGRIPILARQFEDTREMVGSCLEQLSEHECGDAFNGGNAEVTLIWQEPCGVWCRARPDWLPENRDHRITFYDYKTTASPAHPDRYQRTAFDFGLDIQAAWYSRGIRATLGVDARCRFVVQEREAPWAISVIEMSPAAIALADAQIERAIEIWRQCLAAGIWPGYPARVHYVEPPAWYETRVLAREETDPVTVRRWIDAPLEGVT